MRLWSGILSSAVFCVSLFSAPSFADPPVKLTVLEWEGYISPFEEAFEQHAKDKGLNVDLEVLEYYITTPSHVFETLRRRKADIVTPTNNYYKAEQAKLIKTLAPIDTMRLKNYNSILKGLRDADFDKIDGKTFSVPMLGGSYGLAYNANRVSEPSSWAVLFDPANQGQVSATKDQIAANFYVIQAMMNVPPYKYYDIDSNEYFDRNRVQEFANKLIANIDFPWTGVSGVLDGNFSSTAQNSINYTTTYGFGLAKARAQGQNWKLANPKEGQTIWVDAISIAKHVEDDKSKQEAAYLLLDFMISRNIQQQLSDLYGVSMVHADIAEKNGTGHFFNDTSYLWQPLSKRTLNMFKSIWRAALQANNKNWQKKTPATKRERVSSDPNS